MRDMQQVFSEWENNRHKISRPCTLYKKEQLQRAKERLMQGEPRMHALAEEIKASFADRFEDEAVIVRMVEPTTPGPCLFNMPAEHDCAMPHGLWDWDPSEPEVLKDRLTGTTFPNERFIETNSMKTTWGNPQTFSFYSEKTVEYNGYHLYASYSGHVREKKVEYTILAAYNLALLYALTEQIEYAQTAARILLRFAHVYPNWLVHGMYGDIADMDPKTAAVDPSRLPKPRTALKPNVRTHALHAGHWGLGRGSSCGMEGSRITLPAVIAYDLIADAVDKDGRPLLNESQKIAIERDLLIESVTTTMHDPSFNNKSIGNRIALATVGMIIGIPTFAKTARGLFDQIMKTWYLPDGTASESAAYGFMVLDSVWILGEILHEYDGFEKESVSYAVYHQASYQAMWQALVDTLLQNLRYPPIADSYSHTALPKMLCMMMAHRLGKPEYRALYHLLQDDIRFREKTSPYHFLPVSVQKKQGDAMRYRDRFFPYLKQSYMRTGHQNESGTLIVNASDWGIHHHFDSLDLYYHDRGTEWLSDLGYLWDQPHKHMTVRTLAHQTVVVDQKDQIGKGRKGTLHHHWIDGPMKVTDVSSNAYDSCACYRRATLLIAHSEQDTYIVDLFRVHGGRIKDQVFHGPSDRWNTHGFVRQPVRTEIPYDLTDAVRLIPNDHMANIRWQHRTDQGFCLHLPVDTQPSERFFLGNGFGQRGKTDVDESLPYLIRRCDTADPFIFVTVMNVSSGRSFVRSFEHKCNIRSDRVVINVRLNNGIDDLILYHFEPHNEPYRTPYGTVEYDGTCALVRLFGRTPKQAVLLGGKKLQYRYHTWTSKRGNLSGKVIESDENGFLTDMDYELLKTSKGQTAICTSKDQQTGFLIMGVENRDGMGYIKTRDQENGGYVFNDATRWLIESSDGV